MVINFMSRPRRRASLTVLNRMGDMARIHMKNIFFRSDQAMGSLEGG
jgi:hypothetical protein